MVRSRYVLAALFLAPLAACGSSAPPASAPAAATATAAAEASAAPAADDKPAAKMPDACEPGDKEVCLPPPGFVKRLCANFFPDATVAMFAKGTPWTRAYSRVNVEAWNASGGAASSEKLQLEEELIIVAKRVPEAGGMTVSGASGGSYDVLRWDGSCASLMAGEVTLKPTPSPKFAKIPWKSLADDIQAAMMNDAKVSRAVIERKKECKGASTGEVSLKCVKADEALGKAVFEYVHGGGTIPAPAKLP
ncbi:MAG: hypothetical protein U0359_27765 [Byssovorax sp.]